MESLTVGQTTFIPYDGLIGVVVDDVVVDGKHEVTNWDYTMVRAVVAYLQTWLAGDDYAQETTP